jgi:hypothetical protein
VLEVVANVVFGAPQRRHLFICASTSLHTVQLAVVAARTF